MLLPTRPGFCADEAYVSQIQKWRQEQDDEWRSARSPLHVFGIFKVPEGTSTLGSDPASTFQLPKGSTERVGTFLRQGHVIRFAPAPGIETTLNGKPQTGPVELHVSDKPGGSDRVGFGEFVVTVRQLGDEFYLGLLNPKRLLLEFAGLTWFPIDQAYNLRAHFRPYPQEEKILVSKTFGPAEERVSHGDLVFRLGEQEFKLKTFQAGDHLFVMFRDVTSGVETYGGGRYIEAPLPENGETTLDFNKAYNPDCAIAPYTACPVPPRENRLPVRIPAGETYKQHR
jgi:uncharacterized protein (DUF1684 family)